MFIGRSDTLALMGVGAGVAAASPWFAGSPIALAIAAALPAVGGAYLARSRFERAFDRVDTTKNEDFILPSDETYGLFMPTQKGLRMGYTRDKNLPLDVPDAFLSRHMAIIGQSGVGKTTLGEYLLWQQVCRGGGFIFIDAKLAAETRDHLGHMMRTVGREQDFQVLNVDDPENSNTYNPLIEGDADEIASRLMNLTPAADNNPGADHYRQSANYALTVIIGALQACKKRFHFMDLAIMLQSGAAFLELERMTPAGSPERMSLSVFLDQFRKKSPKGEVILDVDKVKTILGGMSGRIAQFAQGKFGEVFNTYKPEINLTDVVLGSKCLYVMLPTMGKGTAALSLGKMVISDLRTSIYKVQALPEAKRPTVPFVVFADEMGSYVLPESLARIVEQARSANICFIGAFQSFANLAAASKDFSEILVQNTWNKVFFKFSSQTDPEIAAELIGKEKKHQYSVSTSESEGESAINTRTSPQGSDSKSGGLSQSWRETEDFRVTPEQIRRLGMGECIATSGGRIFHIKTPMIKWPKTEEYRVLRFPSEIPAGIQPLAFDERYGDFLLSKGPLDFLDLDDPKTLAESDSPKGLSRDMP